MKVLIDVVNFNPDASCLSSKRWLEALEGGKGSEVCRWLSLYLDLEKRLSLGFTGAALADLKQFNPEALKLIRDHPEIFEVVSRSFSHDVSLLRSREGFTLNLELGVQTQDRTLGRHGEFFLPAEFMLTGSQVASLAKAGVHGTFLNPARFRQGIRSRLPAAPYQVAGVLGQQLLCLPMRGELTEAYLHSLHQWEALAWNQALEEAPGDFLVSWRDGESFFFVPDGVLREAAWLRGESTEVERSSLAEQCERFLALEPPRGNQLRSYPVHSFSEWIKEFRMMGYLSRLEKCEQELERMGPLERSLWLQAINSDVLSSIEKGTPEIRVRSHPPGDGRSRVHSLRIERSERAFEGEEALELLEASLTGGEIETMVAEQVGAYWEKLRARIRFLAGLEGV